MFRAQGAISLGSRSLLKILSQVRIRSFVTRAIAVFACALIFSQLLWAQSTKQPNPNDSISAEKAIPSEDGQAPGTLEEEMKAKRAIKFAEKARQDNLERARDLADLGKGLLTSFKRNNSLDREAGKKLDRLEKLTKRVRNEAGGSDNQVSIDKAPSDLASAVARLADVAESLRSKVEKTPRQVISTSVIDEANVLLEVIGLVRNFSGLR